MNRITHFLSPPVFADDEEKTRKAYLLNIITLSSFSGALLYGLIVPAEQRRYAWLESGVTVIVWLVMRLGHRIRAASVALVAGSSMVIVLAVIV